MPSAASYDAAARTLTVRPSSALATGAYVLDLEGLRDAYGAAPPRGLATRFTVGSPDTTPPDTTILTGPSGITRDSYEPFTQAYASEPLSTYQCSFDSGAWRDCPADKPSTGDNMANGAHTFRVRAVDGAGRADPTPATRSWTIDWLTAAPANDRSDGATTLSGGSGIVQASSHRAEGDRPVSEADQGGRSIWFRWTAPSDGDAAFDTAGSGFDTLLGVFEDDGRFARLASGDDAAPGVLTSRAALRVRSGRTYLIGVDGYGGQSGAVTLAWSTAASADTTPPQTTITDGPRTLVADGASNFGFGASEAGATFECSLDDGSWFACEAPESYTFWAGQHTLRVRATDQAGNTDPSPASWAWSVDRIPPTVSIPRNPGYSTTARTVTFGFSADEPGVRYECRLDRGAWAACTEPHTVTVTEPGPHELDVRGIDPAGHTGEYRRAIWILLTDVQGDFDGDGAEELVAGMPGEAGGSGAVVVLPTGSRAGAMWTQASPGVQDAPEAGDGFGSALAAGDFDADGFDDLAIGAPGENAGAGIVHVLRGSAAGLTATEAKALSQATAGFSGNPAPGDRLGAALVAGRFDAGGSEDLAIGVPGDRPGSLAGAGAVHVWDSARTSTFHRSTASLEGEAGTDYGFGTALATGDLGGDGRDDLAIGVPYDGPGAVNVLFGGDAGLTAAGDVLWSQDARGVPDAGEAGDRFGAALAVGGLGGGLRDDLAIGAPGEAIGDQAAAGAVTVLFDGATARQLHESTPSVAGTLRAGNEFGSSLAVTGGSAPWLGVSAPGEDAGAVGDAGGVIALPVSGGVLTASASRLLTQATTGVPDSAEPGDRFGSRLASFGMGLAAGTPGEDVGSYANAGTLTVLPFAGADGAVAWHQNSPGVPGNVAAGDELGTPAG